MIGAFQTGPHGFGGHIMAGANLLMSSLSPGAILEFSAPTGSGACSFSTPIRCFRTISANSS